MAIKKLYKIELNYEAEITEEDLVKLQKFAPSAKFKELKDFKVESYYKDQDQYKGWTDEQFEQKMNDSFAEYMAKSPRKVNHYSANSELTMVDLDMFLAEDIDVAFEIKGFTKIQFTAPQAGFDLSEYAEIFKTLEGLRHQLADRASFNSKCNVHIGGAHMMTVNRTMLCEDYCTDQLQDRLNEGWRIMACCVQDARRPDYILGKYDASYDDSANGALRG